MPAHLIIEQGWSYEGLWQGCMLMSIAHAVFVADAPDLAHEISWDGFNYNMNNSQGSRGTITFHPDFFVAGFRNDELSSDSWSAKDSLSQAPEKVIRLAEQETLQYLLENIDGEMLPSITTAVWGDKKQIFSCHPLEEMLERGGNLLEIQSMNPTSAFDACEEEYEFTEEQMTLLKKLFHLKIAQLNEAITLSQCDIDSIGSRNAEGIYESKLLFAEIGIEWI